MMCRKEATVRLQPETSLAMIPVCSAIRSGLRRISAMTEVGLWSDIVGNVGNAQRVSESVGASTDRDKIMNKS